jgi:hypothetical protein
MSYRKTVSWDGRRRRRNDGNFTSYLSAVCRLQSSDRVHVTRKNSAFSLIRDRLRFMTWP